MVLLNIKYFALSRGNMMIDRNQELAEKYLNVGLESKDHPTKAWVL